MLVVLKGDVRWNYFFTESILAAGLNANSWFLRGLEGPADP